jgi:DNA-binding transcriptional LysR family regulator
MAIPDLADLGAFAAVARARSFRGAAAARNASASALSEAVRRLEADVGVRLLNRTTRSVTPTEAGSKLLERLEPALGEVASALDGLNLFRDSPAGTLRLNVPGIVARLILPPIATAFLAAHPKIVMEVVADDSFIDVFAAGFDAGVRYDERLEQDMIAIALGPRRQSFVTAAATAYLDARGRPEHPRDLLAHDCLRHRFPSGALAVWEFERDGETVKISPSGPLVTSSIEMEIDAALGGLGIVASFDAVLDPLIAAGRLERVLGDWAETFSGPFLYYPSRRHMTGPMRAFVDWLKRDSAARAD